MKTYISHLIILCMGIWLTACHSTSYLTIDTYQPAKVTFPKNTENILIVNNAVTQPDQFGHELIIYGRPQLSYTIPADSILENACQTLGKALVKHDYFKNVYLFNYPLRKDRVFFSQKMLTQNQVDSLCTATATDAIISLEKLIFTTRTIIRREYDAYFGITQVSIDGLLQPYLPGHESPLPAIKLIDTLYWDVVDITEKLVREALPTGKEALREAAQNVVANADIQFIPYWQQTQRWYYKGSGARWKEASVYVANEKWDQAAERWLHIYRSSKNKHTQGMAASNLALHEELNGDLNKALDWANKAAILLHTNNKNIKSKEEQTRAKLYVTVLQQRIKDDQLLTKQIN